jgi:hypothetical protein
MRPVTILFVLLTSSPTVCHAQETPHLAFVSEYVRELITNEKDRAQAEQDLAKVAPDRPQERFVVGIRASTSISLDLTSEVNVLSAMHLDPPFEDLIGNIVAFYGRKIALHREMIDISTKTLSGPQPGVDYGALVAKAPQLTAEQEFIDKSLFQATPLIFATLIDVKHPDKEGHASHLNITRGERDALARSLNSGFGKKRDADAPGYIAGSASVLRDFLTNQGYRCSDEP